MRLKTRFFSYLAIFLLLGGCVGKKELRIGDPVWAEWTPNLWYHGFLDSRCAKGFKVRFDDQDEKCNSFEELAEDAVPWSIFLKSEIHLLAIQSDGTAVPAQVLEARGSQWLVKLPDGKKAPWGLERLRLLGSRR